MAETDPFKVNVFKTATFFKKDDAPKKKKSGKIDFEEWNFDRIKTIISKIPSKPYQLMFKLMEQHKEKTFILKETYRYLR